MGKHRAIVRSRQGFVRWLAVLVPSTAIILGLAVAGGVVAAPTGSALPIPTLPTLPGVTTTIPLPIPVPPPTLPPAPIPTPPVLPGSGQPSKPSQSPPPQPPPSSPPATAAPAPAPSSSANSGSGPSGASTPLQQGSAFSGLASSLMSGGMTPSTTATDDIPPEMLVLYQQAAPTCPGLPWTVLAGIGKEETNHGRNVAVSSARAMGVMQFMPATFAAVGVDGNKDGKIDINDPADSVFSAAHYLCTNGAGDPNRLYDAIFAYNHADWYVQAVLSDAAKYASLPVTGSIAAVGSYALPLNPQILAKDPTMMLKPHHDFPAVDLPVPVGTPVYAVTAGTITPSNGTCGNGLLLHGTDGFTYQYCHGSQYVLPPGSTVKPGELILLSGNTGASTGPHLHFGIMHDGKNLCPQQELQAWYDGVPATPVNAPTTGCFY
jgi:peptidoglycan LD-endopeptidase LytH